MSSCEHTYEYRGQITWPSPRPRPGSGAHDRYYADHYYCSKCLDDVVKNERVDDTTFVVNDCQYEIYDADNKEVSEEVEL